MSTDVTRCSSMSIPATGAQVVIEHIPVVHQVLHGYLIGGYAPTSLTLLRLHMD